MHNLEDVRFYSFSWGKHNYAPVIMQINGCIYATLELFQKKINLFVTNKSIYRYKLFKLSDVNVAS